MRIELTTIYDNVDEEWLDWYIHQLKTGKVPIDLEAMRAGKSVSFTSGDPTSKAVATTTYQVIR